MNTSITNRPRILFNYGNGSEVLDLVSRANMDEVSADFLWWSKSPLATERINQFLPTAHYIESQNQRLSNVIPPFPLHKVFPELCNEKQIEAAARTFPEEWITYALRWDKARAAQAGKTLEKEYQLLAALHLAEAVRILSLAHPALVVIRGGTVIMDAALAIVAKTYAIPVLYTERGAFPESLFLAPGLIGPDMVADLEKNGDDDCSDHFIRRYMEHDRSAWMQPERQDAGALRQRWGIPADHRVVFYAAQRPADANMLLNSPHFSTNGQFIRYVLDALRGVEKTALVIKPHPKEPPTSDAEIQEALKAAAQSGVQAVCDRDVNIKDAIQLSSVVVSINSTTGLEALLYGAPVVAGGEAYYSHQGYTFDVRSATDSHELERLRGFLRNPEFTPAQQKDFHAFICQVNARYQFFMEPGESRNGPSEYMQAIVQAASTNANTTFIPGDMLGKADALLRQYSVLQTVATYNTVELIKSALRYKWLSKPRQ